MYGSWDMEWYRENFLVILDYFLPFCPPAPSCPPNNLRNQNFEKMKKLFGDFIILDVSHKWKSYDVWFLRYGERQRTCCHFGPFWAKKNSWRYHHFTHMYQNYNQMMYSCWDMVHDRWTDIQMDGKSGI